MGKRTHKTQEIIDAAQVLLDVERPMTLRHLYYLLLSDHVLRGEDSQACKRSYRQLARIISLARRSGEIPFRALVDTIRTRIKPSSWSGLSDFVDDTAELYRKDLWARQKNYVEIWVEKDAIAGVVSGITYGYDVNLRPVRGYSSLTFLHQAAEEMCKITKPVHLYYLGDHDPSGHDIERASRDGLFEMFGLEGVGWPAREVYWTRLGLNIEDMEKFEIIPLPAKPGDSRYKKFTEEYGTDAAELEALPPEVLRGRVRAAIEQHIDAEEWKKLQRIEELERATYQRTIGKIKKGRKR